MRHSCHRDGVSDVVMVGGRAAPPPLLPVSLADRWALLTDREREVARLRCEGMCRKQVAAVLGISHRTVEGHCQNIMRQMGMQTMLHVCVSLVRERIVD